MLLAVVLALDNQNLAGYPRPLEPRTTSQRRTVVFPLPPFYSASPLSSQPRPKRTARMVAGIASGVYNTRGDILPRHAQCGCSTTVAYLRHYLAENSMLPYITLIYPHALWLLLALLPFWLLALPNPRRITAPIRFWFSLGLRSLILLLLVLSIAGAQLRFPIGDVTSVFVLDSSDSIAPIARAQGEDFIRNALLRKDQDDQAAIVVFGDNALVERNTSPAPALGTISSLPATAHTDIQEALQLGLALLPDDTHRRLVLLSDGSENTGNAAELAAIAASRGIPIDVVDLHTDGATGEARVTALQAPTRARNGQEVPLTVIVESDVAQTARLRLFADRTVIEEQEVQLEPGSNEFQFRVPADEQGFQRYRARIEPTQDNRLQNNEAAALVQIQGEPRVLLVEGTPGDARNLQDALQAANITVRLLAPEQMPQDLTGLGAYDSVVLVNVAARRLPVKAMAALPTYVRDLGRGLIMIGGTESYGVGGYGNTPVEEVMPVYMDVRDRIERPDLALVFVIDKSGSMDACHCAGPNRMMDDFAEGGDVKLDIAKEALVQAAALLDERDTLGIVTFDTNASLALPATEGATPEDVLNAIADVQPQGNTNVRAGLLEAEEILNGTDASIKHVILLTDGWGEGGNNLDVATRMREAGITVSVVAAGSGSATYLDNLAQVGGGRYYPATMMSEVPAIFLQETIVAVGNYIIERPLVPAIASDSPILNEIEPQLPLLYGFNGSSLKESARNVLIADDGSTLLAGWQYGLGRSIAWTSDTRGQWARDWVQWDEFPRFAAQMVGWVLPDTSSEQIEATVEVAGSQVIVDATIGTPDGQPADDLTVTGLLLPDNSTADGTAEAQQIILHQVAPGQYRASIPAPSPGTYLLQLQGAPTTAEAETAPIGSTVGVVVPYSAEYQNDDGNHDLLVSLAETTGGRVLAQPDEVFVPTEQAISRAQDIALPLLLLALLLLPLDIAVRRFALRRSDLARIGIGTATPPPAAPRPAPRTWSPRQHSSAAPAPRATPPTSVAESRSTAPQPAAATPPTPPEPAPPAPAPDDPLERLRAAKERARRRARGED